MHPSSYRNMQVCRRDFPVSGKVLDIGAMDVNGSYRPIFADCEYTGCDMEAGPNVDMVLADPYHIPVADGFYDCVISGQAIEHCEYFWLFFAEAVRVLKPGGYLFLIAPSAGPIHRYPVDCWRFLPDGYAALAKANGVCMLRAWRDDAAPWHDLTGVFLKPDAEKDDE